MDSVGFVGILLATLSGVVAVSFGIGLGFVLGYAAVKLDAIDKIADIVEERIRERRKNPPGGTDG